MNEEIVVCDKCGAILSDVTEVCTDSNCKHEVWE
jgi:hypothetical protein